jgi:hypothetical protein
MAAAAAAEPAVIVEEDVALKLTPEVNALITALSLKLFAKSLECSFASVVVLLTTVGCDVNASTLKIWLQQFQLDPKCLTWPQEKGRPALLGEMQQVHVTGWVRSQNKLFDQGYA